MVLLITASHTKHTISLYSPVQRYILNYKMGMFWYGPHWLVQWCNVHSTKTHNYTFVCIYWTVYYQRSCPHHWNFLAGATHMKTVFTVFYSVTVKLVSPLDMFPLHCSSASCWTEVTVSGSDTCSHAHRASVNRCASAIEEHPAPTQTSILASSSVTSTSHVWTTGNVYAHTQTQAWMHAQVIKMLREWCSEILTAAFLQSETPPRTYAENMHFHLCVISAAKKKKKGKQWCSVPPVLAQEIPVMHWGQWDQLGLWQDHGLLYSGLAGAEPCVCARWALGHLG